MNLLEQYTEFLENGGLIPYALAGLDYLRRDVLEIPPPTRGVGAPYVLPFTGGQCATTYAFDVTFLIKSSNTRSDVVGGSITGPIQGITAYEDRAGRSGVDIVGAGGSISNVSFGSNAFYGSYQVSNIRRSDGLSDNCGNLPNPNPPPSPSSDGLATSDPPNFSGAAVKGIVTGAAVAADGSAGFIGDAADDFTAANALALTNIAGALAALAAGLGKLLQVISLINDLVALLKKLFNKGNKSSFYYNFGNLRYDGFIRLQSEPPTDNITPLYLDLQATTVKVGASRIFGAKSPNYYNREPIGYIHFVSPTFGVLSSHEVRFARTSIPIPSLAYGFFYNLGLDGVNRANASGFYLKQEE